MNRQELNAFIADLIKLRDSVADDVALTAPAVYPKWSGDGETYTVGQRVLYNDILYKVLIGHTSQPDWTPIESPSLFAKVLIPDEDVIPEWEQPDSTNPYMKGDKVTYNGKTWVSLVDNNVWEPSVGALWEIIDE